MDNVHFDNLYNNTMPNAAATAVPQFVKRDPSLFKDEVDIRISRTLNNCKVPQIGYATDTVTTYYENVIYHETTFGPKRLSLTIRIPEILRETFVYWYLKLNIVFIYKSENS